MKLSVIIVNYNVMYYALQCIYSVLAASKNVATEIFVVDNASSDGSVEFLTKMFPQEQYPDIHIIGNKKNLGFGKANNLAARRAQGEYVLFLNPDTVISETTLEDCLRFADQQDRFGALGVKMLHDNGSFAFESRRGLPTPWTAFCKMSGLAAMFPQSKKFGKYYMRYLDKERPAEIEIISGAFMMAKKSVLDKVGLFDERFFMYGEDIDLSYRILLGGYKNYYYPSSILHYKGESTHKNSYRYVHNFYQAMLIFFRKHFKNYSLFLSFFIKIAIYFKAMMALMRESLRKLRRFIHPHVRQEHYKSMFFGKNVEQVSKIAQDYDLDIHCVEANSQSLPAGHNELRQENEEMAESLYITYDTSAFSFGDILSFFEKSDNTKYMGFYHPQINAIITGGDIYHLE